MRLTSVVLHSLDTNEDIEFSLRESRVGNRYIVRTIVGIDAEEIIAKFYGTGLVSGNKFHDYVMKPRDIAMRVGLNPKFRVNETVSEIRDELYRIIAANRTGAIQLQFKSGGSTVKVITGRITKFEVAYFENFPELQITVNCPDPMFRSILPATLSPAELPSVNPVVFADNESTAPHGLSFSVVFTGATATFTIQDKASSPDWKFEISPVGGFDVDDELHFSSEYGDKQLYITNVGGTTHLMDRVDDASTWPIVFHGRNELYFLPIANFDWLELSYHAAYWGV
jgi:hypothetical protein